MDVKLTVGQLVCSTSGRDKDKLYLVWGSTEKDRVLVVDGINRRIENPKKKNTKHLKVMPYVAEAVQEKISRKKRVTNADIEKAINEYREKLTDCV